MAVVAKEGRRRRRLPVPVTVALALVSNAGLGAVGYVPYLVTVYVAEVLLLLLGWIGDERQVGVSLFLAGFVLIILWMLYLPLVVTINRGILRRSAVPARRYWSFAVAVLLVATVTTGALTYGPSIG